MDPLNIQTPDATKRRKITRPIVSDLDGTREGGLMFPIILIVGIVAASMAHPAALTSFWVWFVLLMMSVAVSIGTQKAVARWNDFVEPQDDDDLGGHGSK